MSAQTKPLTSAPSLTALSPAILQADREELTKFIGTLFRYAASGTFVSLRSFDQFDSKAPPFEITGHRINRSLDPLVEAAAKAAFRAANNEQPIVFAPPIATFVNEHRAAAADLANGLVLSVELDEGNSQAALRRLESILGFATCVVESGSEWIDPESGEITPKIHMHWRLSEPTMAQDDHDKLREARNLASLLVGGDPTGKPVVHPLRWPGSWNRKNAPRMARIAALNESAEVHLNDALERLREAVEAAGVAQAPTSVVSSGKPEAPPDLVVAAMMAVPNPDLHYDDWIRIGYATMRAMGDDERAFAVYDEWSRRSAKYQAEETDAAWRRIRRAIVASPAPVTVGAGTIFFHARRAGWKFPEPEAPTTPTDPGWWHSLEQYLALYQQKVEVTPEKPHGQTVGAAAGYFPACQFFDPWAELQPPSFPIETLPPVLRAFVEDRARIIGADPCALAWAAISATSAALDGGIRLKMKKHDNWSVPPAIWVALVGRPSTKKSPVINAAWEPLHRAQRADLNLWRQQVAEWKSVPKNDRDPEQPKPERRLVSHDGTMEALQDILSRQDRGIGILRDELSGWIGSLEKYGGAKSSAADRAFFLQAYNGGPNVIDRVARGLVDVKNLLVTICGGIQPDRLRQFSDLTDDGLWQRFVPIIVGPATRGLDDRAGPAVGDYAAAIHRILTVPGTTRPEFSDAAHGVRADMECRIFDLEQGEMLGAHFSSFCGKLAGLWGRLCLVLNYLDPEPAAPARATL
jgi:hypothetical protein